MSLFRKKKKPEEPAAVEMEPEIIEVEPEPVVARPPVETPVQRIPTEIAETTKEGAMARIVRGEIVEREGKVFHRYVVISTKPLGYIGEEFSDI